MQILIRPRSFGPPCCLVIELEPLWDKNVMRFFLLSLVVVIVIGLVLMNVVFLYDESTGETHNETSICWIYMYLWCGNEGCHERLPLTDHYLWLRCVHFVSESAACPHSSLRSFMDLIGVHMYTSVGPITCPSIHFVFLGQWQKVPPGTCKDKLINHFSKLL